MGKVYLGLGLGFSYVLLIRYDSLNVVLTFDFSFPTLRATFLPSGGVGGFAARK